MKTLESLLPGSDRMQLMHRGILQLEAWLSDLIRTGFLENDFAPESLVEISARLVDAKLGGLARRVRRLGEIDRSDPSFAKSLLGALSSLYLYVSSFKRIDTLELPLQHTILSLGGYAIKKDRLMDLPPIEDRWIVLGQTLQQEDQLRARRTWLAGGQSKRTALVLEFAFGRSRFEHAWHFHKSYRAELRYYPGAFPIRALVTNRVVASAGGVPLAAFQDIGRFVDAYVKALSKNPWIDRFPCTLSAVKIIRHQARFVLIDRQGRMLPIQGDPWHLYSIAGGQETTIFGEWNGRKVMILSYWEKGQIHPSDIQLTIRS